MLVGLLFPGPSATQSPLPQLAGALGLAPFSSLRGQPGRGGLCSCGYCSREPEEGSDCRQEHRSGVQPEQGLPEAEQDPEAQHWGADSEPAVCSTEVAQEALAASGAPGKQAEVHTNPRTYG